MMSLAIVGSKVPRGRRKRIGGEEIRGDFTSSPYLSHTWPLCHSPRDMWVPVTALSHFYMST